MFRLIKTDLISVVVWFGSVHVCDHEAVCDVTAEMLSS